MSVRRREIIVDTSLGRGKRGEKRPRLGPMAAARPQRNAQTGIKRVGHRRDWRSDFYHNALTLSWPAFLAIAACVYFLANTIFALLYMLQPGAVMNARPGSFWDLFFFSVETFGTIGYGVLAPQTPYANTIMTLETLCGIMLVALTTGLMFARVSRPTARVLFAKLAVVTPYEGVPMLMVRMGNERTSQIVQAEVGMTLVRNEMTREGHHMRRFYDLKLERGRTPVFAMSFLAMHALDEMSPLYEVTEEQLKAWEAELLVTVTGVDQTMAQTVHARASYLPSEVKIGHRYVDIFGFTQDGEWAIDYRKFHDVELNAAADDSVVHTAAAAEQ